jgi:hypothetical protein
MLWYHSDLRNFAAKERMLMSRGAVTRTTGSVSAGSWLRHTGTAQPALDDQDSADVTSAHPARSIAAAKIAACGALGAWLAGAGGLLERPVAFGD